MDERLRSEIEAIAADDRSGATALLTRGLAVLRAAAGAGALAEAGDALCRAQASMAGLRTAVAVARGAADPLAALEAFAARVARAPRIIARHAVALLRLRQQTGPIRLVTCSRSSAVEHAIRALVQEVDVEVACAEGRPALEGRDLAAALATAHVRVTLYTDAGVTSAIERAEAFLSGADAVGPHAFLNKVGTGALAAMGAVKGIPTYVLAGREKFLAAPEFTELRASGGPARQVWSAPAAGVVVANPYFEQIPVTLVSAFITDGGVISPDQAGEVAQRQRSDKIY